MINDKGTDLRPSKSTKKFGAASFKRRSKTVITEVQALGAFRTKNFQQNGDEKDLIVSRNFQHNLFWRYYFGEYSRKYNALMIVIQILFVALFSRLVGIRVQEPSQRPRRAGCWYRHYFETKGQVDSSLWHSNDFKLKIFSIITWSS